MLIRETNYDVIFDAQRHFRQILDCMARPGKVNVFQPVDIQPAGGISRGQAYVALGLLNADTGFHFAYSSAHGADYVVANTGARMEAVDAADFIFENRPSSPVAIEAAKEGHPNYPDLSATLVVAADFLSDAINSPSGLLLELSGPGIKGSKHLRVAGPTRTWWDALVLKNSEFPLGIDLILTADQADGSVQLACIPRTTKIQFLS